jgi:sulfatase maturation enzyme AslB (radical SAM superfamily)
MYRTGNFLKENISVLHLEPTTKCNLKCPQCVRYNGDLSNNDLRDSELSLSDIKNIVPESFVKQLSKIFMCGNYGEPAAAKDTLDIYRWFRKINPSITLGMNTNGSLRSEEWWFELGKIFNSQFDYVVWSIDGLEDTNQIYRRNSIWPKIIANAKAFIKAGGSAHWDMLVFQHNQHQVKQAEELAKELGFTWFRAKETFRKVHPTVSWLKKISDSVPEITNNIECQYDRDKTIYLSAHGEWIPCCYIASYTDSPGPNAVKNLFPIENRSADLDQMLRSDFLQKNVIASWNTNSPFEVCKSACSKVDSTTRALSKWKYEVQLK